MEKLNVNKTFPSLEKLRNFFLPESNSECVTIDKKIHLQVNLTNTKDHLFLFINFFRQICDVIMN